MILADSIVAQSRSPLFLIKVGCDSSTSNGNLSERLVKINTPQQPDAHAFRILSDIERDVWHAEDSAAGAYEWWYFDAVSDDGRDVLVIIFLDNFIFSPRYNRRATTAHSNNKAARFPALTFCLYRDGRPVIRSLNEYTADEFEASTDSPACRIGASSFVYNHHAKTYRIELRLPLRGKKFLRARLDWQTVEASLMTHDADESPTHNAHEWNVVAPRCRVTGDLEIMNQRRHDLFNWSGTGYHDHNRDARPLAQGIKEWQWGRAHFDKQSAVFYRFQSHDAPQAVTRLLLVENDDLTTYPASCTFDDLRRNIFGLSYPRKLNFGSEDSHASASSVALYVEQDKVIDASFFYLRFTGRATLLLNGRMHRAPLVSEMLVPRALEWTWLDWLVNMRIARNGKTAFLP